MVAGVQRASHTPPCSSLSLVNPSLTPADFLSKLGTVSVEHFWQPVTLTSKTVARNEHAAVT